MLIQNAECFLKDMFFSFLVPSLPHWMCIAIGGGIPSSSEIKRQVRNNFHTSYGLKLLSISTMQNYMGEKHGKAVLPLWKYWGFENDMAWIDRMGRSGVSPLGYTFTFLHEKLEKLEKWQRAGMVSVLSSTRSTVTIKCSIKWPTIDETNTLSDRNTMLCFTK